MDQEIMEKHYVLWQFAAGIATTWHGIQQWHSMVVIGWNGSMGGFLGACVSIKKLTILLKTFSLFLYLIFYLIFYFIYTDLQPILTKYHPQTATLTLF